MSAIDLHLEWFLADDSYITAYPKARLQLQPQEVIDVEFDDILDADTPAGRSRIPETRFRAIV